MCLVLPSRVVVVDGEQVEVELANGERVMASAVLRPDVRVGDYVLVDRGMIVETIAEEEARTILEMYREIGELLDSEDAAALAP